VAVSGNALGLTWAEWSALDAGQQAARRTEATALLRESDPDYVIDSVADLLPILDQIEARIARGERPAMPD